MHKSFAWPLFMNRAGIGSLWVRAVHEGRRRASGRVIPMMVMVVYK
jgi:hypothetical protein